MVKTKPKKLTLLAASIVAAGFLVEPAHALTPITQQYFFSSRESAMAVQAIKQSRCYGYRDGRRAYRSCPPRRHKAKRKARYGTSQNSGYYYKPWTGIQLCENCPAFK